jgi:hypothetical protein
VYATPTIIGDLATTTTVTEVSTAISTITLPASTVTQTIVTQITIIEPTITQPTTVAVSTGAITTQSLGVGDVVQSCVAYGDPSQILSCALPNPVTSGHLMVVETAEPQTSNLSGSTVTETQTLNLSGSTVEELQPPSLSDSLGDSFTLVASVNQPGSAYSLYVFVANIVSDAADQVTVSGSGSYPFLLVRELQNVSHVVAYSTGMGSSSSPSVLPYVAPSGSFVLAGAFILNYYGVIATTVTAGPGNTLLDTGFVVAEEYNSAGASTASPFVMTSSVPWAEVSLAFS